MMCFRFVNLITERQQKKVARPLRRLAKNVSHTSTWMNVFHNLLQLLFADCLSLWQINIPEWVVNLRHDLTHRKLPSLKWCRKGDRCFFSFAHANNTLKVRLAHAFTSLFAVYVIVVLMFVCVLQVVNLCWTGCIKSTGLARWAVSWQRTGTLYQKMRTKRKLLKGMREISSSDRQRLRHTVSILLHTKISWLGVFVRKEERCGTTGRENDRLIRLSHAILTAQKLEHGWKIINNYNKKTKCIKKY